jgi:UDP-N-acetylglucosamine 4,6-dehydratase/5-epimerase
MAKILITGGAGFLGKKLAIKLKDSNEVLLGSRNNGLNQIALSETGCNVVPLDVANIESVRDICATFRPEIIIHAAATKYVNISEEQPLECIDVNITGSQNVARVAVANKIQTVIGISTDKAAPPVNHIYGLSKAMMERMFCSLDYSTETNFSCVRFGNIAWSTGSVFPIWKRMMESNNLIESTGSNMKRFIFSVDEAADLVLTCIKNIHLTKGKILSQKMKSAKILDVLEAWKDYVGTEWVPIQQRVGETIDEVIIGSSEVSNTIIIPIDTKEYFLTSTREVYEDCIEEKFYTGNAEYLSKEEIIDLIKIGI